jgi:hypothetical protein
MNPPFTVEQFLGVFSRYNQAVWPAQIALNAVALLVITLAARPRAGSARWISGLLALLWAWMGIVYHWTFFRAINPAAILFGALFLLQAGVLFTDGVLRRGLAFRARADPFGLTGAVLITYALLVYPLLGALAGHGYPRGPTFGVPCPTTIFTFGILLWADGPVPLRAVAIPAAWSVLGLSAALSFTIVEDLGLLVSGVVGTALIVVKNRRAHPTRPAVRRALRG